MMSPVQLLVALAREFGVAVDDLRVPDRQQSIAAMRCIAMATLREHTRMSYPEIGRLLLRDHTTVMSGCARAVTLRVRYPELAEKALRAVGAERFAHEKAIEALEMCA